MPYKTPRRKKKILKFSTPYRKDKGSMKKIIKKKNTIYNSKENDKADLMSGSFFESENQSLGSDKLEIDKSLESDKLDIDNIEIDNLEMYKLEMDKSLEIDKIRNSTLNIDKNHNVSLTNDQNEKSGTTNIKSIITKCKKTLKSLQHSENILISHLKKENKQLRDIKSSILTVKNLLGLEIIKSDDGFICSYETICKKENVRKFIKFLLSDDEDDSFSYKLLGSENIDLPDLLCNDFCFEKRMLPKFVFDIVIGTLNGWRE
ncbi:hypothetical protein DMUE_0895 [Dictyocoela muelleri]|nr:hypothetical protein DMUE_0895 [Dictyocoela muelleri]